MSAYQYTRLSSDRPEFRLLKVRALIDLVRGAPLVGSLRICQFPEIDASRSRRATQSLSIPRYNAVSYAWGEPVFSHDFHLADGTVLKITPTLDAALRDIRSTEMTDFYLWADAICINQKDMKERSVQVHLIQQIYHTADAVLIWLGVGTSESDPCLQFISDLCATRDEQTLANAGQSIRRSASKKLPVVGRNLGPVIQGGVTGFSNVFKGLTKGFDVASDVVTTIAKERKDAKGMKPKTYESDDDTVNSMESAISPGSAKFAYIDRWEPTPSAISNAQTNRKFNVITKNLDIISMAHLIEKILLLEPEWYMRLWCFQELSMSSHAAIVMGSLKVSWIGVAQSLNWMTRMSHLDLEEWDGSKVLNQIKKTWHPAQPLLHSDLVRQSCDKKVSDPRDKIYALLGALGNNSSPLLVADYSLSVKEIYTMTTLYLITNRKSFDAICGYQTIGRTSSLPSWVPDFSLDQGLAAQAMVTAHEGTCDFDASRGHQPSFAGIERGNMTGTRNHLSVTGVKITTITQVHQFGESEKVLKNEKSTEPPLGTPESRITFHAIREALVDLIGLVTLYTSAFTPLDLTSLPPSNKLGQMLGDTPDRNTDDEPLLVSCIYALMNGRLRPNTKISGEGLMGVLTCRHLDLSLGSASDPTTASINHGLIADICHAVNAQGKHRSIIYTEANDVGAASGELRVGDVVVVLLGCSVPVILRRVEIGEKEEWFFIGECFLDGFMEGDAMGLLDNGVLEMYEFILR